MLSARLRWLGIMKLDLSGIGAIIVAWLAK